MIEVTPNIIKKFPAVFKVARRDKMRVVWLEQDLAYCARRTKGHDRYLVKFVVSADGRVGVDCHATSGRPCSGMRWRELCAHAAKVILRGVPKGRQKQTQEAA